MQNVTCQRCGKRPATTHLTELSPAGGRAELHLCATCIQLMELHLEAGPPLIAGIIAGASGPAVSEPAEESAIADCPSCGMSFADFGNAKRFGCAQDYCAWEDRLIPLLEGYHGADRHIGRRPGQPGPASEIPDAQRSQLDQALRTAIAREDYETAAQVRDEIRQHERSVKG